MAKYFWMPGTNGNVFFKNDRDRYFQICMNLKMDEWSLAGPYIQIDLSDRPIHNLKLHIKRLHLLGAKRLKVFR